MNDSFLENCQTWEVESGHPAENQGNSSECCQKS